MVGKIYLKKIYKYRKIIFEEENLLEFEKKFPSKDLEKNIKNVRKFLLQKKNMVKIILK